MPASHHPDDDDDDCDYHHHRIHHPSRAQQLIGIPSPVMDLLVGSGTTSDHHQTSSPRLSERESINIVEENTK